MSTSHTALIGAELVLFDRVLSGHALLLHADVIEAVIPVGEVPASAITIDLDGLIVTPGLIDLQVNGGDGVLLNDAPTKDTIERIARAHLASGTTSLLPTLISDRPALFQSALSATQEALDAKVPGVLGLHLEGPFLAAEKKGIHNDRHFRRLGPEEAAELKPPRGGHLLLTLAPEEHDARVLQQLRDNGVVLSAGHTLADYDQAREAIKAGVSGFTHLYNAMPQMFSRDPGPVAAALESSAWCMLIADGHHVHPAMLRLAIRAKADGRIILVSDAMSLAGSDLSSFVFDGKTITEHQGRLTDEDGRLAGSALTLLEAVQYLVRTVGTPLADAVRYASLEPARFLGLEGKLGSLRPGAQADLNVLTHSLNHLATIQAGDVTTLLPHLR
jgi:N-acetylglucosamine-6-phosphate deacetylase